MQGVDLRGFEEIRLCSPMFCLFLPFRIILTPLLIDLLPYLSPIQSQHSINPDYSTTIILYMLQGIVQRILQRVLGEYLDGFNSKNLNIGIWSGQVKIQNVRLKKSALLKLGLPIELKYSLIQNLVLKIPWKSLTSSKTELYLDGLFIVLGKVPEKEWDLKDERIIEKRKKEVSEYAEAMLKMFLENQKKEENKKEEEGFTERIILRIIDNLQVEIKNIHIRLEEPKYCSGLTLENFKLNTVNKLGVPEYIDRSKSEHKNEPLRKKLEMKNFGVYSNMGAESIMKGENTYKEMVSLIGKDKGLKYLILLNFDSNLIEMPKGQTDEPEIKLTVGIKKLLIEFENEEIQELIYFSENIQKFKRLVKQNNEKQLIKEQKDKYIKQFSEIFDKYYNRGQVFENDQEKRYENILAAMGSEEVFPSVKQTIQNFQKRKRLEEKQTKKIGWFSYGKKELTAEETQEVEKFILENFAEEVKVYKRPEDYGYIQVSISLNEATIFIGKKGRDIFEGIVLKLVELSVNLKKREKGLDAAITLTDMSLDLVENSFLESRTNFTNFFKKQSNDQNMKYINLVFSTSPANEPHLDMKVFGIIQPSVIYYTPAFVDRIKAFIKLEISDENSDRAFEKINEYKDKTTEALDESINVKKDSTKIGVDLTINAPLIIVPFLKEYDKYCWGMNMGQLKFQTQQSMMNSFALKNNIDTEKYLLTLDNLNAGWFSNKDLLLKQLIAKKFTMKHQMILSNFGFQMSLELSKKESNQTPNVSIKGELPQFLLSISDFTYKRLLQIQNIQEDTPKSAKKKQETIATHSIGSKKEIIQNAEKTSGLFYHNPRTKLWQKYMAVLKGNYIYLFDPKSNATYESYVYIKNSHVQVLDAEKAGRAFTLRIKNKVNDDTISFLKEDVMKSWMEAIEAKTTMDEVEKQNEKKLRTVSKSINPNKLKVNIFLSIESFGVKVFNQGKEWMDVRLHTIVTAIQLYEYRKQVRISLKGLTLDDTIEQYLDSESDYLIKSGQKNGQFIDVWIHQKDQQDPNYKEVVNEIEISIGILWINLKPLVNKRILEFFIPVQEKENKLDKSTDSISTVASVHHQEQYVDKQDGKTLVKLKFSIEEISICLINSNTKIRLSTISIKKLELRLDQSASLLTLKGVLGDLNLTEQTNYPNTIVSQKERAQTLYLMKTHNVSRKELLVIEIKMLKGKNADGKDILVDLTIKQLMINYFQQPILRILDFLTLDFLPSLKQSEGDQKQKNVVKSELVPPTPSSIDIKIKVLDSMVMLRTSQTEADGLKLSIPDVEIKNISYLSPDYGITQKVLLQDYVISIKNTSLQRMQKQITNDFNIEVRVHLIQNPLYYKNKYPTFKNEMRIECNLSSFLARINNAGFNFMMKVLNHNIAYNDYCDQFYYPNKVEQERERERTKQMSDPILFKLGIEAITLVVAEEILPNSNLGIKDLRLEFSGTNVESSLSVKINDISGSYFEEKSGKLVLRQMINTSRAQQDVSYEKGDLIDLKQLVKLLHNVTNSVNPVNDVDVQLDMKATGQKDIAVKLEGLYIDLKLKPLLKLSKIVNIDPETQAPVSKYPPVVVQQKSSELKFWLSVKNIKVRGGSDDSRNEAIMISIAYVGVNLRVPPEISQSQILSIKKKDPEATIMSSKIDLKLDQLEISLVETVGTREKKRVLLKPASITFFQNGTYYLVEEKCMLSNDLQVLVSGIVFEVTTRDLLKLNVLYTSNMAILNEENKEQYQKNKLKLKQTEDKLKQEKIEKAKNTGVQQPSKSAQALDEIIKSEIIKELKGNIQIRCFNLKVLHHSQDLVLPVLMLDLHDITPIYRSNPIVNHFTVVVHIDFNYFNPRSSQWEPIFEKIGIHIEHIVTHKDTGDETLMVIENVDEAGFDEMNINVSSQFLTSLSEIISLNKKEKEKVQKNLLMDEKVEVSPFVLQNMTLSDIQVQILEEDLNIKQLEKNTFIVIKPQEKKPIVVPLQSTQLKIRIEGQEHIINIASIGKRMISNSPYIVDCQVEKLFKVIVIMSRIIIENKTTKPLLVKESDKDVIHVEAGGHTSFMNSKQLSFGHEKEMMSKYQKIEDMFLKNSINFKGNRLFLNISKEEIMVEGKSIFKLIVEAPIKLINLLPYTMLYQVLKNGETKATKSLDSMKQYEIFRHQKGKEIELKINIQGFYWSKTISFDKILGGGSKLEKIQLRDQDFNETMINVFIEVDAHTESMEIIFFPSGYIVNDTPYDLICLGESHQGKKHKSFIPLAGQEQIQSGAKIDATTIVFGPELGKKIKFADKETPDHPSSEIEIAGIGDTEFEVMVKQMVDGDMIDTYAVCIADRSLKTMMQTTAIQKEIRITPKHIIQNKTDKTIFISQENINKQFQLKAGERKIFFFFSKDTKKIKMKTAHSEISAELDVDSFGLVNFYVNQGKGKFNLKINVCTVDNYSYISISPLLEKEIPYRIKNNVEGLEVKATIIDGAVSYGEEVAFLWKDPSVKRVFELKLKNKKGGNTETLEINPDDISVSTKKTVMGGDEALKLKIYIDMKDGMKVVTIDEDNKEQVKEQEKKLMSMNISLRKIGISLIMNHSKIQKPYEALFISFHELQFIHEVTSLDETYQARMKFFQIDQNYPHLMAYPVVITPSKFKHYMKKEKKEDENQSFIINILVVKDPRIKHSTVLKSIKVEINDITIRVSQLFIRLLLEVFSEFKEVMALHFDESVIVRKNQDWTKFKVSEDTKPVFIQELMISPFEIQISLRLKEQNSDKSKMKLPFENLISAFGVNLIDIDEAPIFLRGIIIQNCFDNIDGIKSKIITNYKWAVLRQFYKLIGSMAIIGNPIGLFKNISTGLSDMVEKPASGIVKGPLQLGRGIAEGGYSLVAHTLGGALSSLDKMTGALSTGLAFLCLDPGFEEKRQKQKNKKPKNVLQGLEKGAKAVFSGFKEGITGIFLKPYENAAKDGFLGFLKGTYQGLTGAVIKPVTGILDFASKTTEGLKNTLMFFEDKPNQSRMRCPRPFYGQNSLLKQYNIVDAEIMNVLQFVRKGRFADCKFLNVFMIQSHEQNNLQAIVIVDLYIINLSFQKKEVHWYIEVQNIINVQKSESEVIVVLKKHSKFFKETDVRIKNLSAEQVKLIYHAIEERLQKLHNYIVI